MKPIERYYPESRFGGYSDIDGSVAFYGRVQSLLGPRMTVVDVGCGRGAAHQDDAVPFRRRLRDLRGEGRRVVGIDVDLDAAVNPCIDEFRHISIGSRWPIEDASVDILVSDFVLEHIDDPRGYFMEVRRVLKVGGMFCARTTNRLGYVGLAASLVPNRRHYEVLKFAQRERRERDVFPTYYRVNSIWAVKRELDQARLQGVVYGYEAEPSYLQFSRFAYALGKYVHAVTPSFLRTCLFVYAKKTG